MTKEFEIAGPGRVAPSIENGGAETVELFDNNAPGRITRDRYSELVKKSRSGFPLTEEEREELDSLERMYGKKAQREGLAGLDGLNSRYF